MAAGESLFIYQAVGCAACDNRGYKGRMAIMELLKFDAELDELVTQRASLKTMNAHLRKTGFVSMAENGMRKVRDGFTTVEEIGRVVDLTEFIS
jgi:general secretion pathway protein E/type IV pilus assembly protein PilB